MSDRDMATVRHIEGRVRYLWRSTIVRDASLSLAELRVLMLLECYANPSGGDIRPGRPRIARELGVSEKTVTRCIAKGIDAGYLRVVSTAPRGRGNTSTNVYALALPSADSDADHVETVDNVVSNDEIGDIQVSPISVDNGVDNLGTTSEIGDIQVSPITRNRGHLSAEIGDIQVSHYQITTNNYGLRNETNSLGATGAIHPQENSSKGTNDGPAADASRSSSGPLGPEPDRKCSRHLLVAKPPNCGLCADARKRWEAWNHEAAVRMAQDAEERRKAVLGCRRCDEHGFVDLGASVRRCDHSEPLRVVGE